MKSSTNTLGLAGLIIFAACPVWADPADESATVQAPPEPPARRYIEEIVVTATKREASMRDIPASITALEGAALEDSGMQSAEEFLRLTPGVNFTRDGTTSQKITIRGIAGGRGLNQTTGMFIDSIPFTDPFLPRSIIDFNPFDLQSVEVLKGPQGTLFGGSALNGAIRYRLNRPEPGVWETRYYAGIVSVKEGGLEGNQGIAVNAPLGQDSAVRAVGFRARGPGWIDETLRGERDVNATLRKGWRAMLRTEAIPRLDLQLLHIEQDEELEDYGFGDSISGERSRSDTPLASPAVSDYRMTALNATMSFGWGELVSDSSTYEKKYDAYVDQSRVGGVIIPGQSSVGAILDNRITGLTQELRAVSANAGQSRWSWLVGAYYTESNMREFVDLFSVDPVTGPLVLSGEFDIDLEEYAVYGDTTVDLYSRWKLGLGLRAYRVKTGGTAASEGAVAQGSQSKTLFITEQGLSPKMSLVFDVSDNIMAYLQASRGFRFGGIQANPDTPDADVPPTYQSDILWNYELGVRTQWLTNTLQADLTLFRIDWTDAQVNQLTASGASGYVDNVGSVEGRGLELALQYLPPVDGLTLGLSGSWSNTQTAKTFMGASGEVPAGTEWPAAPEWQAVFTAAYGASIGEALLSSQFTWTAIAKAWDEINHTQRIFDYQQMDLQFEIARPSNPRMPRVQLVVSNLTDELGLAGSFAAFGDYLFIRPRTYTLRISGEF